MGKLDDKVSIVTGAGAGIGRAIAEKLTAEGAIVIATDVDESAARSTADALRGDAIGVAVDLTDREAVVAPLADLPQR